MNKTSAPFLPPHRGKESCFAKRAARLRSAAGKPRTTGKIGVKYTACNRFLPRSVESWEPFLIFVRLITRENNTSNHISIIIETIWLGIILFIKRNNVSIGIVQPPFHNLFQPFHARIFTFTRHIDLATRYVLHSDLIIRLLSYQGLSNVSSSLVLRV